MFDVTSDCGDTADAFDAQDRGQWRQIAAAPGDDRKIRPIDRRGLECDHDLVRCGRADIGNVDQASEVP